MNIPEFSNNPPERCYHCKKELFSRLWEIAREKGFKHVADGTNYDDLDDFRPGIKAGNLEISVDRNNGGRKPRIIVLMIDESNPPG